MAKTLKFGEFECVAEPGIVVRGTSVRLEFTYNGRLEKAWFASLADVHTQQGFELVIKSANATRSSIKMLLTNNTFTDDIYASMLPNSGFAKNRGGGSTSTFGEVAEKYILAQAARVRRGIISHSTVENRTDDLNSHVFSQLPYAKNRALQRTGIRNMRLCDIKPVLLTEFQNYLDQEHPRKDGTRGYSTSTTNNYIDVLKQVFDYAVRELHLIDKDPSKNLKTLKRRTVSSVDIVVFTPRQQEIVYKACIGDNKPWLAEMFRFGCYMGMRKEELIGLAWEDIDIDQRCVFVQRAFTYGKFKDNKNTKSRRIIPMLKPALESILRMRELTEHQAPTDVEVTRKHEGGAVTESIRFVFMNMAEKGGHGPRPWNDTSIRKAWDRVKQLSGVDVPLSQVRHTFSTNGKSRGVSDVLLAAHLGHSDTSMINRSYGGVRLEFDQNLINVMDKALGYE